MRFMTLMLLCKPPNQQERERERERESNKAKDEISFLVMEYEH